MTHRSHSYGRMEYMKRKPKPMLSDGGKQNLLLGPMVQVFFSVSDTHLKDNGGKTQAEELKGPSGPLVLEPKDILAGRHVLKELYPRRKVQAWQHQTILAIGKKIETQYRNAMEKKREEAIKAKEEEMKILMEERIKIEVRKAQKKLKRKMDHIFKDKIRNFIELQAEYIRTRDVKLCSLVEKKLRNSLAIQLRCLLEEKEEAVARERDFCRAKEAFTREKEIHDITMEHKQRMEYGMMLVSLVEYAYEYG